MAAYETTRRAPFGVQTSARVTGVFAGVLASLAAWNDVRVTRKALSRLSDRELDDIGLTRADIERIGETTR